MTSILDTIKKLLGIDVEYTQFDNDLIVCINSVLASLVQIGIGPETGFSIEDNSAEWTDLIDDQRTEMLKSYVHIKVRLLFDPPMSSAVSEALNQMAAEYEFRLSVIANPYEKPN